MRLALLNRSTDNLSRFKLARAIVASLCDTLKSHYSSVFVFFRTLDFYLTHIDHPERSTPILVDPTAADWGAETGHT